MRDHFVPMMSKIDIFEGEKIPPPQALTWYPDGLAWQIDVRKNVLRKQEAFKEFQRFLVHETEVGSISRQETVSMIPPLFLDVQPEHIVLDMCAAPGSKTAQIIEALHSPTTSSPEAYDPTPSGLVVANDSDQKRAYMLVHQAARLPSPNLIVTNVDAGSWPRVSVPWKDEAEGSQVKARDLRFDRILGDVPCSGDGTLRKNVGIWKEWTPNNALGLHSVQLRILLRGLSNLKPGGRMVYSTCSLNPIENEAVIAAALRECGADPANGKTGSVQIIDVSEQAPELKRRPGLTTWKVCPGHGRHLFAGAEGNLEPKQPAKADRQRKDAAPEGESEAAGGAEVTGAEASSSKVEGSAAEGVAADASAPAPAPGTAEYRAKLPAIPWVESWDRLNELDRALAARTAKTLWPKGDEAALGLEKCMRVYPHLQNTGGFFVTVLEKRGDKKTESMSKGMVRAVEALDAGAEAPDYSLVGKEKGTGKATKRPLSPSAADGEEEAKRVRTEDEDDGEDEDLEDDEPAAPSTHVKPDNHAADRAAKEQHGRKQTAETQRLTDAGYGLPGGTPFREDPYNFVKTDNEESLSLHKFFAFSSDFPSRNLLVRNPEGNPLRSIYLTSTSARAVLMSGGPGVAPHPTLNPVRLRCLNSGVKAFARQDSNKTGDLECRWRLVTDGLAAICPFLSPDNIIPATLADLAFMLSEYYPFVESLPDGEFKERVCGPRLGSFVMAVQPSEHDGVTLKEGMNVCLWRAATSINLMMDKTDRTALSNRIFGTDLSAKARQQALEMNAKRKNGGLTAGKKEEGEADATVDEDAAFNEAAAAEKKEEQLDAQVKEEGGESAAAEAA